MRFRAAAAAITIMLASSTSGLSADTPPYAGSWDCEVATFTFTGDTYDSGEGPQKVLKVEREDGNYILTLPDDYRIGLSSVTAKSMEWLSMASGDTFHCTKIEP